MNDATQIAGLLSYLRQLQRQSQLAVVLVHHARKDSQSSRPGHPTLLAAIFCPTCEALIAGVTAELLGSVDQQARRFRRLAQPQQRQLEHPASCGVANSTARALLFDSRDYSVPARRT